MLLSADHQGALFVRKGFHEQNPSLRLHLEPVPISNQGYVVSKKTSVYKKEVNTHHLHRSSYFHKNTPHEIHCRLHYRLRKG